MAAAGAALAPRPGERCSFSSGLARRGVSGRWCVPSAAPSAPPAGYTTFLVVDAQEVAARAGGLGSLALCEQLKAELARYGTPYVVAALPVGDYTWVAFPAPLPPVGATIPWADAQWRHARHLGHLVERKEVQDLWDSLGRPRKGLDPPLATARFVYQKEWMTASGEAASRAHTASSSPPWAALTGLLPSPSPPPLALAGVGHLTYLFEENKDAVLDPDGGPAGCVSLPTLKVPDMLDRARWR